MKQAAHEHDGLWITFEGGEGAGKSTVISRLAAALGEIGQDVLVTREPGGVELAEQIRALILDPRHTAMNARTEALLYAAARSQHLTEKIMPALQRGAIVLCDRFVDSSLVYQGFARGLGMDEVWAINRFAIGSSLPDLTLYLDIEPRQGLARIQTDAKREQNRLDLETLDFHHKVREGYLLLKRQHADRIVMIDAGRPLEQVTEEALSHVQKQIDKRREI